MLGFIGYMGVSIFAAMVLMFLYSLVRPIRANAEFRPGKCMLILSPVLFFIPYGLVEVQTRLFAGPSMDGAVNDAIQDAQISRGLLYYKVLYRWGDNARLVIVGSDDVNWSKDAVERTVLAATVHKDEDKWNLVGYTVVSSIERGADSTTLPPFW